MIPGICYLVPGSGTCDVFICTQIQSAAAAAAADALRFYTTIVLLLLLLLAVAVRHIPHGKKLLMVH